MSDNFKNGDNTDGATVPHHYTMNRRHNINIHDHATDPYFRDKLTDNRIEITDNGAMFSTSVRRLEGTSASPSIFPSLDNVREEASRRPVLMAWKQLLEQADEVTRVGQRVSWDAALAIADGFDWRPLATWPLAEDQKSKADTGLSSACGDVGEAPKMRAVCKRMCKGHINKVNSVHFSGDSRHLVSGSLDGKLIIWDIFTGNKTQIIPLRSAWVMSVAFSPSGNLVASGGMDNQCTVHDINDRDSTGVAKIAREMLGYEGFLSSMRFIDDNNLITGSGDMKVDNINMTLICNNTNGGINDNITDNMSISQPNYTIDDNTSDH
ncbi:guanine nucleotide-binding protein G(I)/G(S)/G(T) subunit beta-1-like [Penaeus japonicus]|uniref:guanine nucleotide-binding protein G(I)/G(S)/G(T) subunit beta-1-like n=1 Tax=Penaeus japonicus TaxID=27405 RepID=UPI001C716D1D|nr:guanine nucleotide-binding protein G(I)/G(S)/G(T) subunit beta-1-like [Penaeus japonicus]